MKTITIIGAGMMGSALAFPARENGNTVRLVGSPLDGEIIKSCRETGRHPKFNRDFPAGLSYFTVDQVQEAIAGADFIIGGVSSFGVDWFGTNILPLIPEEIPVITVTKGLMDLEDGTLLTYPELWDRMLAEKGLKRDLYAIGGPCTSYELVQHDPSMVSFCGRDPETLKMLREALQTDYYHISLTTDRNGIETAVALKNGYALGIALTIGLNHVAFGNEELHFNSQAAVFGQGAKEMQRLMRLLGCTSDNSLMTGIGDLYVTVYGGRTRLIGILLGEGDDLAAAKAKLNGVTLESLVVATRVARAVKKRAARGEARLEDYPLLCHIDAVLTENAPAAIPYGQFTYEEF